MAAPGVEIFSTLPNHPTSMEQMDYGYLSGTSMATAFVTGLAGLVWTTGYGTDNARVREQIESTCEPISGTGIYWKYGRINAYNAVR